MFAGYTAMNMCADARFAPACQSARKNLACDAALLAVSFLSTDLVGVRIILPGRQNRGS